MPWSKRFYFLLHISLCILTLKLFKLGTTDLRIEFQNTLKGIHHDKHAIA